MRAKPPAPDGHALWQRVAETVRPLKGRGSKSPLPAGEREGPKPKAWEGEGMRQTPRPARLPSPSHRVAAGPSLSPKGRGIQDTLDGGWDRRLRRGVVAPDMTIDLHGHTLLSAQAELEAGLASAILRGARLILLVTGRAPRAGGERIDGRPVRGAIRASVGDWLHGSRHAGHVAAVRNAHPRHGGAGALYIVLRRGR